MNTNDETATATNPLDLDLVGSNGGTVRDVRLSAPGTKYLHISIKTGQGWTHVTLEGDEVVKMREFINGMV